MIIFLAGTINSGKSSVASILVEKIPECVNFDVDKIIQFVDHIERPDIEVLILNNIVSLLRDYVKRNLNVVVHYTFADSTYDYVVNNISDVSSRIRLFTLSPSLKTATSTRGARIIDKSTAARIKYQYKLGIHNLKKGTTIDNSDQQPEETVAEILSKVNFK